MGEWRSSCMCS